MITKVVLIIGMFCGVFGNETKCDTKNCPKVPIHYEELGCTPVIEEGKCCPSRFECLDFKNLPKDTCVYKNKIYNLGDMLEESITDSICEDGCYCAKLGHGFEVEFNCPIVDFIGPPHPGCIEQRKADICFFSHRICDKAEIEKLSKCEFEGRTYREGEKMYPENRCYSCICSKDFENVPVEENPNCKRKDCGISLRDMGRVRKGCAPIYYDNGGCCPNEWRCPKDNDEIETRSETETMDKCEFGKLKLNVGDVVKSSEKCTTCKCTHPPMMHCIKDAECYKSRF